MLVADWLGRYLIFPYELGAGVLASLLGGGYFLLHLRQPHPRARSTSRCGRN